MQDRVWEGDTAERSIKGVFKVLPPRKETGDIWWSLDGVQSFTWRGTLLRSIATTWLGKVHNWLCLNIIKYPHSKESPAFAQHKDP